MSQFLLRLTISLVLTACLVTLGSGAAMAENVGNPTVPTDVDSTGNPGDIIFDVDTARIWSTGRLINWSFFDDDDFEPNRIITPMIIREEDGVFFITGIGETRTTTEGGLQKYPFTPQSGSDFVVGDGTYFFGFRHGTPDGSVINLGIPDTIFEGNALNTSRFFVLGNNPTPVGSLAAFFNAAFPATYSYSGTVQAFKPIPTLGRWGVIALLMLLAGFAFARLRKPRTARV